MFSLEKVKENSVLIIGGDKYTVLGLTYYVTEKEPDSEYVKILLNDEYILVVMDENNIYFGRDLGQIKEFDGALSKVLYNGKEFNLINHDYQIVKKICFGSPIKVEGEVEFWDYELDDIVISTAINSRKKTRADVAGKYISKNDIDII